MNDLVKEINSKLLHTTEIEEYLRLKKEIENDQNLTLTRSKLDKMRKEICKDKEKDSTEYYELLNVYKSDLRIRKYEKLQKEIREYLLEISDILSLK